MTQNHVTDMKKNMVLDDTKNLINILNFFPVIQSPLLNLNLLSYSNLCSLKLLKWPLIFIIIEFNPSSVKVTSSNLQI